MGMGARREGGRAIRVTCRKSRPLLGANLKDDENSDQKSDRGGLGVGGSAAVSIAKKAASRSDAALERKREEVRIVGSTDLGHQRAVLHAVDGVLRRATEELHQVRDVGVTAGDEFLLNTTHGLTQLLGEFWIEFSN